MDIETTNAAFRAGATWALRHYACWPSRLIAAYLDDIIQVAWVRYLSGQDADTGDLFRVGKRAASEFVRKNGEFHYLSDDIVITDTVTSHADLTPEWDAVLEAAFFRQRKKQGSRGRRAAQTEVQILRLLIEGYTNAGIAHETGLAEKSIKTYRARIRQRLEFLKNLDSSGNI